LYISGTLVSFRGTLEDHYLGCAQKCGVYFEDDGRQYTFADAFRIAYKEMSHKHPCFGANLLSTKEWWKLCVLRSFELAGVSMTPEQQDIVFQRIYSTFGSHAAYEIFDDTLPFLRWAQRKGIVCGVLSNADERYGDSILPMLGLTPDELQFQCFSKDCAVEKPDVRFFLSAMKRTRPWLTSKDDLLPSEVLHIGNDFSKDFEGARRAGMHALLLDRYDQKELVDEWRRRGAQVFQDLVDVVEFLGRSNCQFG
jgi:putative hydrolase of the HAD superfamily